MKRLGKKATKKAPATDAPAPSGTIGALVAKSWEKAVQGMGEQSETTESLAYTPFGVIPPTRFIVPESILRKHTELAKEVLQLLARIASLENAIGAAHRNVYHLQQRLDAKIAK